MIPLLRPLFPNLDLAQGYFKRSAAANQYTNFGPCHEELVLRLEKEWQASCMPVTNATLALQMVISSCFDEGTEILVPDFTFPATILAVIAARCIPVIGGCDATTWTFRKEALKNHRAIIATLPMGHEIDNIALEVDNFVIYDAASAWFSKLKTNFPAVYSWHTTKNFGVGEGACVMSMEAIAKSVKRKINYDFIDQIPCSTGGTNAKLDEFRCALALSALSEEHRFKERAEQTVSTNSVYRTTLCPGDKMPTNGFPHICTIYKPGLTDKIIEDAKSAGIMMRRYYWPLLSDIPAFSQFETIGIDKDHNAKLRTVLALPSNADDVEREKVIDFVKGWSA